MKDSAKEINERTTGQLFGSLFSAYDDKAFVASMELFSRRFQENGFPLEWFQGRRCLDAGCGGGRYSLAMAALGAREVMGVDISETAVADARKRAAAMGLTNVQFESRSLERLAFEDEAFDAVIFSGVLQHTSEPCRVLDEVIRVLRPGGMFYTLIYATEGLRWPLVQMLRPVAQRAGFEFMDEAVAASGLAVNRRRTYLDDLFVPYIDFYSWPCLKGMLEERGMVRIERWTRGRLDHEEDMGSYRKDLVGFQEVFAAAVELARVRRQEEQSLLEAALGTVQAVVRHLDAIIQARDRGLDEPAARELAIGQGHHRVVAWKEAR